MIDGVIIKSLKRICDDRGTIFKMLESSDAEFKGFGEIYFSMIYPGVVKGWHLHKDTSLSYAVPQGMIKLVLFDGREGSETRGELMEICMGQYNYVLVQIPKNVWNGFACVGNTPALVADLTEIPHERDEMLRMDPHEKEIIGYDWTVRDR